MDNPVLVEVTRGSIVESRHRGALAIVDGDGRLVLSIGDIDRPTFPRSAVKAFQALPLIESGAADRFGFGNAELALAIASHSGEERHVAVARSMLAKAGLDEGCLECGAHWPSWPKAQAQLNRMGAKPGRVHNNCSGKHAGFICTSVAMGHDPAGYVRRDHPLMREVIAAAEAVTGAAHGEDVCGTDGCSIPTFAIAPRAMARGFATLATGRGVGPERAAAFRRLREAAAAEPFLVAGSERFDTVAMEVLGTRAFVKTGAEGVYTAALPEAGLGIAVKIDDGAARASEVVTANLLAALLGFSEAPPERFAPLMRPAVRSWAGEVCGEIRVSEALTMAVKPLAKAA